MFLFLLIYFIFSSFAETLTVDAIEQRFTEDASQRLTLPITGKESSVELAGISYPLKEIDDCNTTANIGFKIFDEESAPCEDTRLRIHPEAEKFLENNLNECATQGLIRLGIQKPIKRIVIGSQGIQVKRKARGSRKWSNHSTGAAVDINYLDISFIDGTTGTYPTAAKDFEGNLREGFTRCKKNCGTNQFKRKNRYTFQGKALFYESFYNCLLEKTEQLKQNGNCSGGTLGCHDESGHDNHIHLSVPLCPKPRGVVER